MYGLLLRSSSLVLALNISSSQNIHLNILFNSFSFLNFLSFVDFTTLLFNTSLLLVNIDVNDIILVELFRPSFRDSILHLILQLVPIWTLCKCLTDRLFMKLIKLIIELCNHFLNILRLLILVKPVDNSLFNVFLCIA